jgi:hypothetical protein
MLIQIRGTLPKVLHILENQNLIIFIHISASLHCFIFLISVIGVKIYNILDSIWIGRPSMLIRIRQNVADQTRSGSGPAFRTPNFLSSDPVPAHSIPVFEVYFPGPGIRTGNHGGIFLATRLMSSKI